MSKIPKSILVTLSRKNGWWYATSEDIKGLLVAHPTITVFSSEIPKVIKSMLKIKFGCDVNVVESASPDSDDMHHITFFAERVAA